MSNIFLGMNIITLLLLAFLTAVGVYDLYRYFKNKKTISQKVHAWFPKAGDIILLCGILGLIWWIFTPNVFAIVLIGVILGHFFWNED